MKKILSAIAAVFLLATNAQAIEINRYLSGSWFNPEQSGHGFSIEVLNDTHVMAYWYVYDHEGYPIFLNTLGEINGDTISGKAYHYSGMKFGEFNPDTNGQWEWGDVSITFTDCTNATLNYNSDYEVFGSGSLPLTKLVGIEGMACSENPLTGVYKIATEFLLGGTAHGYLVANEAGAIVYRVHGEDAFGDSVIEFGLAMRV